MRRTFLFLVGSFFLLGPVVTLALYAVSIFGFVFQLDPLRSFWVKGVAVNWPITFALVSAGMALIVLGIKTPASRRR